MAKSNCDNLNEKKIDIKGKDKEIEIYTDSLDDDDLKVSDIIERFKILNGVHRNGVNYDYI